MKGTVKWFSQERGYGFVTDADGTDYHFSVRQIIVADLPLTGAQVEFDSASGEQGPRAKNIRITARPATATNDRHRNDDRVICEHCGRKMVPRLLYNYGALDRSHCPFCGGVHRNFTEPFELPEWVWKGIKFVFLFFLGFKVLQWTILLVTKVFGE
jgi:CspA family cold shock protein